MTTEPHTLTADEIRRFGRRLVASVSHLPLATRVQAFELEAGLTSLSTDLARQFALHTLVTRQVKVERDPVNPARLNVTLPPAVVESLIARAAEDDGDITLYPPVGGEGC